jgi:hypothetical protein
MSQDSETYSEQFIQLRLPTPEDDYEAYLRWKKEQEQNENNEDEKRVIIIDI